MLKVDVSLQRAGFQLQVKHAFSGTGVTAVFGPSGSGKSTLLRVIAGLETQVSGSVQWHTTDWLQGRKQLRAEHRKVAMVFQQPHLFSKKSVMENILYGMPKRSEGVFIHPDEVIKVLGISPLLQRYPSALSGGQQQRVALARALLSQPRLLLLDEPMTGLDYAAKQQILADLKKVQQRFQLPMIFVSHQLDEVVQLADDVVVINQGQVESAGPLQQQVPQLAGHSDGPLSVLELEPVEQVPQQGLQCWRIDGQSLWLPQALEETSAKQRLLVWARDVSLALQPLTASSLSNQLAANVVAVEAACHAAEVIVTLSLGDQQLRALITRASCQRLALAPGVKVMAAFKAAAVH